MTVRIVLIAAAALILEASSTIGGERATYEVTGFPVSPHQLSVLVPTDAHEHAPTPALTMNGMPASLHQIAVLTCVQKSVQEEVSFTIPEFAMPAKCAPSPQDTECYPVYTTRQCAGDL